MKPTTVWPEARDTPDPAETEEPMQTRKSAADRGGRMPRV